MVAPSLRVPPVSANSGAVGANSTDTGALTIDASAVVGSDWMQLHAAFTSAGALTRAGWTMVGANVLGPTASLSTALFVKPVAAGDPGSSVTAHIADTGRWAAQLLIIKGSSGYVPLLVPASSTDFVNDTTIMTIPAFTTTTADNFVTACAGARFVPSNDAQVTINPPTGWTEQIDTATTNVNAAQRLGVWSATRTIATAGAQAAAVSTASAYTFRYGLWVLAWQPVTASIVANAGADTTLASYGTTTLTGTESGGSGTTSTRVWSKVSGPAALTLTQATNAAAVTVTAPGLLTATPAVLRYTVTDANGTSSSDDVTVTVAAAVIRINDGGTIKPVRQSKPSPGGPGGLSRKFTSPFPGGGGQSSVAIDPANPARVVTGTDTAGPRMSNDGTATTAINIVGIQGTHARQADGLAVSAVKDGRVYATFGDATAGNGGVYWADSAFTGSPTGWTRLDGTAAGAPQLRFNGGNSNAALSPGVPREADGTVAAYPRHYGTILQVDETSLAGFTLLHVATVTDGAWRLKIRQSDDVCVEQVRYPGTAGKFIRSLKLCTFGPNPSFANRARLWINLYSGTAPAQPLLCTNANAADGTTMTTATISGAPTNIENVKFVKSTTPGALPVMVAVKNGAVYLSSNAHSAAAPAITLTNVAVAPGNPGPETDEWWMGCGVTQDGTDHIIEVTTRNGGRRISTSPVKYATMYRGVVPATSATPAADIVWSIPTFTQQLLDQGSYGDGFTWWNADVNTPCLTPGSNISDIETSASSPAWQYMVARGNLYVSNTAGRTWYPSNTFGSADHNHFAWDWWVNKNNGITTMGDWPLGAVTDKQPAKAFTIQPHAVIKFDKACAHGGWFDPRTGAAYIGYSEVSGHQVPVTSPQNTLGTMSAAALDNTYVDLSGVIDLKLSTSASDPSVAAVMCGVTGHGSNAGNEKAIIMAACHQGTGIHWSKDAGATWNHGIPATSGAAPYSSVPNNNQESGDALYDDTRHITYWMERATGTVWRINLQPGSAGPATAVRLFAQSWSYALAWDGIGYIDIDEARDRLWISTKAGVYFINNASTAPDVASGTANATAAGFAAAYPGEIPHSVTYRAWNDTVVVDTQYFSASDVPVYPLNGSDCGRCLSVSNPTVAASWGPSAADNWVVSRDRSFGLGFTFLKGRSRNFDGSIITYQQQSSGVGVWYS